MKHANKGCNLFSVWQIKAKIYYFNDKSKRKQRKKELVQQHEIMFVKRSCVLGGRYSHKLYRRYSLLTFRSLLPSHTCQY